MTFIDFVVYVRISGDHYRVDITVHKSLMVSASINKCTYLRL